MDRFVLGLAIGLVIATVVCLKTGKSRKKIASMWKPQVVVMAETEETPWRVMMDGCKNLFILIAFLALLVGCLIAYLASGL